jgi:Tfp pilus assembly protein PilX
MNMAKLRQRLAQEDGIAIAVVFGVLLVVSLLATAVISQATQSSQDTTRDRNSVRALGAAQAGIAMANYRLNKLKPADNKCVTDVVASPNSGADCTITESVGNGASYTYYVTQKIPANSGCQLLPGSPTTGTQRCITVTGNANGVVRRLQVRVSALPGTPPYMPIHGFVGQDYIYSKNNMNFNGADLGSNRLVDLNNNDVFAYLQLGPGASCNCSGATYLGTVNSPTAFTLQPVPIAGTETANNNSVLKATDGYTSTPTAARSLIMTHDLTLPSGDYNFCRMDFNGYSLSPAAGAQIRVFIDAPDTVRPGSGCPTNTTPPVASPMWGELHGDNAASINPGGTTAADAQIFVYGWPPTGTFATNWGINTVTFAKNDGEINALIYAPNSIVNLDKNNGKMTGGVAGWQVYFKNNMTFSWDHSLDDLGKKPGTADQKGWFECKPQPTNPAVPESGC